jgi:hypothetical protein
MSDSAHTPSVNNIQVPVKSGTGAGTSRRSAIVAAVGGLLVVAAVGWVLNRADIFNGASSGNPAQPTLSFVAKADIGAAATTLTPTVAGTLVEDAERCKIPLVSLTLSRGSAALGSTVRVRSGSYVSPYFTITDAMQRIAVPYPAPYGSGSGTFTVEGNATGAILGLTPTKVLVELPGSQSIPVAWRAVSPC